MNDLSQGQLLTGWKGFWWWQPVTWVPPAPMPCPPQAFCFPPAPVDGKLGWVVTVQCREGAWSANTVLPDWCWKGCEVPTCAVVTELRNGVPCRCFCPPGRCEGKSGRQHEFRPWLPRHHCC